MALANEKLAQLVKVEHYRWHCVEGWPESPHKQAVLAGIRSGLERLQAELPSTVSLPVCMVCAARSRESVLKFPAVAQLSPLITRLAA